MSHSEQLEFVSLTRNLFPEMFQGRRVLEIGSLDINGSIRGMFHHCDYTGLDIGPGPGVDVVCEGQKYDAPDASFDVVICCEVMEHNPFWRETFRNMIRLLKPGGLLVMSCATKGRAEHGTSRTAAADSPHTVDQGWDYYRNLTAKDVRAGVDLSGLCSYAFATNIVHWDLYLLGVKTKCTPEMRQRISRFKSMYRRRWLHDFFKRFVYTLRNPSRLGVFLKRYS